MPARPSARPYRVTVVCLGNICRSPIGEAVLRRGFDQRGLADLVAVDSAGTGDWHLGQGANPRTEAVLAENGYELEHAARQITPDWLGDIDLLLAMDEANYRDLGQMLAGAPASPELRMLRSFDPALVGIIEPDPDLDVPDPYYGGPEDFREVLAMVERASAGVVDYVAGRVSGTD